MSLILLVVDDIDEVEDCRINDDDRVEVALMDVLDSVYSLAVVLTIS